MNHLRIKWLKVKGFRSFVSETLVSFPESGFLLIDGKNLNTGGSSGSGKSSVCLALSYVLGYCPFPATQLTSWGAKEMLVEVALDIGGKEAIISRSPSKVKLFLDGEDQSGNAKLTQQRINELFGLDSDMMAALTYRAQKTPGIFLTKTDAEKKEFLTALLGLKVFEEAVEKAQENLKTLEGWRHKYSWEMTMDMLKDAQRRAEQAQFTPLTSNNLEVELPELKEQIATVHKEIMLAQADERQTKAHYDALIIAEKSKRVNESIPVYDKSLTTEAEFKDFDEAWARYDKLDQQLTKLQLSEKARIAQVQTAIQENKQLIRQIWLDEQKLPEIDAQIAKTISEIESLKANKCYVCNQTYTNDDAIKAGYDKLTALQAKRREYDRVCEVHSLEKSTRELEQALVECEELAKLREEVDSLYKVATAKEAVYEQAKKTVDQRLLMHKEAVNQKYEKIILELQSKQLSELTVIQNKISELNKQKNALFGKYEHNRNEIERIKLKNEASQMLLDTAQKELVGVEKRVAGIKAEIDKLDAEIAAEKDFIKLTGREGFLGSIFEEVLQEISAETNKILGSLPNTSHVSVHFSTESTTQKGVVKKSIVPVINVGGHEAPLASGCSGGMITSIDLAVDLAVGAVIARRTGKMPGWIVLDEAFDGLDTVTKESCMDILSIYAKDRLVMVIDHSSETKELFNSVISVVYSNGESTIQ